MHEKIREAVSTISEISDEGLLEMSTIIMEAPEEAKGKKIWHEKP